MPWHYMNKVWLDQERESNIVDSTHIIWDGPIIKADLYIIQFLCVHGFGQRYSILGFFPKFSEVQCFCRGDSINLVELLFIHAVSTVHVYNSYAYYS